MTRRQVYFDLSVATGGGGQNPDGSKTPYFDIDVMLDLLAKGNMNLVLDPQSGRDYRFAIQCALQDAFGRDGKKILEQHNNERLRAIASTIVYIPPMRTHSVIVVGKHDNCDRPHP